MLPKLHKWKEKRNYRNKTYRLYSIGEEILIEGRPVVAGLVFHTSGISQIIYCIIEPALSLILHVVKDSFDFTQ